MTSYCQALEWLTSQSQGTCYTTQKNGTQRVVIDAYGSNHLQVFMNGSWRHDYRCKEHTNKDCKKK
jgi:hypothetical protein